MPKYHYLAKTKEGKALRDVEDVGSKEELVGRLKARGLFIVSIEEKIKAGDSLGSSAVKRKKRSSVKIDDLCMLARNLSITLSSGITLLRSLEILSAQTESSKLEKILKECMEKVQGGLSLSEATAKYPKIFFSLWQVILEVGEVSGNLPFVLDKLASYLETKLEFQRKIKNALVYPIMLIIAAILAVGVFFKVILPTFTKIFDELEIELPFITQVLFDASEFVEKNFLFIVVGTFLFFTAFSFWKKRPESKKILDGLSLKLPVVGSFVIASCLENFTSIMYILLDSGLPLVSTLEIAARGVSNFYLKKPLTIVKEKVREGSSLSAELSKLPIMPSLLVELTRVGEETGTMPEIFRKITIYYRKELATRIERFVAAFEPILIMVMGVVIGVMVLAIFLPLFQMTTLG
ncbi:MAG: type II secretion system F family protein [Candidatus Omnitrophica bacterium]|nr:type II secretion system F family protein [Candidatus Omnitrophota bacterium]MBU1524118.1 type II secretion system F family protein [Candidatus Omnitrophota bacterium]MBU2504324.1 type II secretion system F family protein [Candidatus Omnitrophota bacterium]